jgi:hypothetical protein
MASSPRTIFGFGLREVRKWVFQIDEAGVSVTCEIVKTSNRCRLAAAGNF